MNIADIIKSEMIAVKNEDFGSLTKAEQCVAIAQDVLTQIELKRFVPVTGSYMTMPSNAFEGDRSRDMRDVLRALPVCNVCALGGLFACAVERADDLPLAEVSFVGYGSTGTLNSKTPFSYLGRFFTQQQLHAIEVAFEGISRPNNAQLGFEERRECLSFNDRIYDRTERMKRIMNNIIANGGTFKPEQKPADATDSL